MLWSDAMQLTTFGMAKLWPLYIYMGSESKYMHCQPSANLCSHAAYFHTVSLADSILMLRFDHFLAPTAAVRPVYSFSFLHFVAAARPSVLTLSVSF